MATDLLKIQNGGIAPFTVIVPRSEFEARVLQTPVFYNPFYVVPDNDQKA